MPCPNVSETPTRTAKVPHRPAEEIATDDPSHESSVQDGCIQIRVGFSGPSVVTAEVKWDELFIYPSHEGFVCNILVGDTFVRAHVYYLKVPYIAALCQGESHDGMDSVFIRRCHKVPHLRDYLPYLTSTLPRYSSRDLGYTSLGKLQVTRYLFLGPCQHGVPLHLIQPIIGSRLLKGPTATLDPTWPLP